MPISSGAGAWPVSYWREPSKVEPFNGGFDHSPSYTHRPPMQVLQQSKQPITTYRVVESSQRDCCGRMLTNNVWHAGHKGFTTAAVTSGRLSMHGCCTFLMALFVLGLLAGIATALYYGISAAIAAENARRLAILNPGGVSSDRFFRVRGLNAPCVSRPPGVPKGNVAPVSARIIVATTTPTAAAGASTAFTGASTQTTAAVTTTPPPATTVQITNPNVNPNNPNTNPNNPNTNPNVNPNNPNTGNPSNNNPNPTYPTGVTQQLTGSTVTVPPYTGKYCDELTTMINEITTTASESSRSSCSTHLTFLVAILTARIFV